MYTILVGSQIEKNIFALCRSHQIHTAKKRSNMSAKGLWGKTSSIPEYITIHRFSTKFKIRSCFLMNINRYVSLETKFCSVCVFLIVTPSKLFALVFDFSALLGDNLNWNSCIPKIIFGKTNGLLINRTFKTIWIIDHIYTCRKVTHYFHFSRIILVYYCKCCSGFALVNYHFIEISSSKSNC